MKKLLMADFDAACDILAMPYLAKYPDFLVALGFEYESLIIYTFACYRIKQQESRKLHHEALEQLIYGLVHLEGAYNGALFHARRRVELDPQDYEYKELLLLFHSCPDHLIDDAEAVQICIDILELNPGNKRALLSLESIDELLAREIRHGAFMKGNQVIN